MFVSSPLTIYGTGYTAALIVSLPDERSLVTEKGGTLWLMNKDGSTPEDNPFHGSSGDELNRIVRSENYGYPEVSEGEHDSGEKIPSHADNLIYENPALSWNPVVSPSGLVIYDRGMFADWH